MTCHDVITPHGAFQAIWPTDPEAPVEYRGDAGAIAYFRQFLQLEQVSGEAGALIDPDRLEPSDLVGFCQSPEYGIRVVPDDFDEADDAGQMLDSASPLERIRLAREIGERVKLLSGGDALLGQSMAALDSILAEDHRPEIRALIEQLNGEVEDRQPLRDRLAYLLTQVEYADEDEEDAMVEAAAQAMEIR